MGNFPLFELVIDENPNSNVEVSFVALVPNPAIEKNFLAFKDAKINFAIDAEKRVISGPAMVANQPIYRKDNTGEYNVFFSPETIQKIVLKFFKKDYQKNINLFHDPNLSIEGVTIFESFISDEARGVKPMAGFEDLPDGSWFISAKIENEDIWNKIKSGEVKGFSVEGIFSYTKQQKSMAEQMQDLLSGTEFDISHLREKEFMSELKDTLEKLKQKFIGDVNTPPAAPPAPPAEKLSADYTLQDGTMVKIDKLEVGGLVMSGDAPVMPGDYEMQDGTKISVGEGGVITAVTPGAAPAAPPSDYSAQFAEINTRFEAYEQKFTEQGLLIQKMSDQQNKSNEMLIGLIDVVQKLSETATADPVQTPKQFNNNKTVSKEEKITDLAKRIQNLKK